MSAQSQASLITSGMKRRSSYDNNISVNASQIQQAANKGQI